MDFFAISVVSKLAGQLWLPIVGENLSNGDGLTSDDDGISQEIVANNLKELLLQHAAGLHGGSSDSSQEEGEKKLRFSALLATLQPQVAQPFNKKGTVFLQ